MKLKLTSVDRSARPPVILHQLPVIVGLDPGADICLDDSSVGHYQCMIDDSDGVLMVWDLGTKLGTAINGVRISQKAPLMPGDELGIGKYRFLVHYDDGAVKLLRCGEHDGHIGSRSPPAHPPPAAGSAGVTSTPSMFKVVLLMSPFAGYDRGLLHGIARYARLRGSWAFYLSGDHPGLPLPGIETLSGVPIRVQRTSGQRQGATLPDLRSLGAGFIGRIQTPVIAKTVLASGLPAIAMDLSEEQLAGGSPLARLSEIRPDSHKAGRLAAEHLLERGFRHFAFCGYVGRTWSRHRQEGFCQRLKESGLSCRVYRPSQRKSPLSWPQEQPALTAWLQSLPKPLGVMACNDVRGRQAIEACAIGGMHVPNDIAVVGVDEDSLLSDLANPPLSSVALDAVQAGYQAAELLHGMMSGRVKRQHLILVDALWVVSRLSTNVIAVEDAGVATALRYIRDNARRSIGVQDVVKHLAVSRRALEIRFQGTLGRSIRAEIERVRLGWAKQMLVETNLPVAKIAEHTGFSSQSYLSRVFHRVTGLTLGRYRRDHRTG